jgi:hypothetical protein
LAGLRLHQKLSRECQAGNSLSIIKKILKFIFNFVIKK